MNNLCDSYCEKCVFFQRNDYSCGYIFDVGHPRGCPPGEGCDKRETSQEKKKKMTLLLKANLAKKFENEGIKNGSSRKYLRISQEEEDMRMQLYRSGYSDLQIGMVLGTSKGAITKWRHTRKLPANFDNCHRKINKRDF